MSDSVFTEPAELYDAIYFGFKDYPAEAESIASLLRSQHPACGTVLARKRISRVWGGASNNGSRRRSDAS